MSRKRKTIITIIIVIVLGFLFMKLGDYHFTPSAVATANEYGLHYGPSEKVLLEYEKDGDVLVIGKVNERAISVIPVKRSFGILWRLMGGGVTGHMKINSDDDHVIAGYDRKFGLIYGITDIKEAKKAECSLEYKNNDMEDFEVIEGFEMEVNEDGFFYLPKERVDDESWYYVVDMKVYDENGDFIFEQDI